MNTLSFFNPRFTSDLFDVFDRNFPEMGKTEKVVVPRVDVLETKDQYILDMELPGFSEKDVDISLKDRVLSITSKQKEDKKEEKQEGAWLIKERRVTSFSRSFTLPEDIDSEKVEARFANGLLSIDIPRRPETQARAIAIKV
jgi:HSP20 family protein